MKKYFKEERDTTFSALTHIKLTLWSSIKAVSVIGLLLLIEDFTMHFWLRNIGIFPKWFINIQRQIPKPVYPENKDSIHYLVSTIASVTGVILALFYPILATIASTAYAKVHASIRNLLLYEKETQGYLRRLTYLTASSIAVLLFMSFNEEPGNLVLSVLAFYSFTTLFGILKIGLGVYNFFEPSTLSTIVLSKLKDTISNVTIDGKYWNEKNFQNHNYRLAFEQMENLSLITALCLKDDELKESSFKNSIRASFILLQYYLAIKPKIPEDSLWFPNIYSHSSFFESDMSLRSISRSTNTFIQPKVKQNNFWLEERVVDTISNSLKSVVERGNISVFGETILMTYPVFDSLSRSTDVRTAQIILDKLLSSIRIISPNKSAEIEINYEEWKDELGTIETYCYALLRFQIGVLDRVAQFNSVKIITEFRKIDWKKRDTIYNTDFVSDLYPTLNKFCLYIENEEVVEGYRVTPNWYLLQSLTAEYLGIISDKLNTTIRLFQTHLNSVSSHFDNINNPLLSSFSSQIGLEIINKIHFRFDQLTNTFSDIDEIEVCKGEFKWIKPNFEEIQSLLNDYESICFSIITKNISKLSSVKWNNQFPDIFAHSYSLLSSRINRCYLEDDLEKFQIYFPEFLKASINAFGNLNRIFKHYDKPQNISYQTLLDLMEISGYSYIYSVIYHKPDYWECVRKIWDEEFLPSKENIDLFATYYAYYKNTLYGTGINYIEKHERESTLSDIIQRLSLRPHNFDDWLVKPFITDSFSSGFYNVAELFIEIYLFTFLEAKNATTLVRRDFFMQLCRNIENPTFMNDDDF